MTKIQSKSQLGEKSGVINQISHAEWYRRQEHEERLKEQLIEENHLKSFLTLSDQKVANNFRNRVVENCDHNSEISIKSFLYLFDEQFFRIFFRCSCFLNR